MLAVGRLIWFVLEHDVFGTADRSFDADAAELVRAYF